MEKKYYFRGLGLGIVVTAIIMGIALSHGTKTRAMTDEEVIARAKELGMIEDSRLLEPTEEESEKEDAVVSPEPETPVKKDIAVKSEAEAQKKDTAADGASGQTDAAEETGQKPVADTPEPAKTTVSATATETKPTAGTNEMRRQDDDGNAAVGEESDAASMPADMAQNIGTTPTSGGTKSVTIANGDSSYTIAKKLEMAGVVSSASAYDTYLCEHGYDKKLRAGTFQIPADATDDQIARIVTGQQ